MRLPIAFAAALLAVALTGPIASAQGQVNVPFGEASPTAPAAVPAPGSPQDVVTRFYAAFQKGDFATLQSLYSPDVHWQDTIFSYDGRDNVMGVWKFEIDPSKGGKITSKILSVDGDNVTVSWSDDYSFFGNPVNHAITAVLTVKNGQIVRHVEDYSWDEWAKQAFDFPKLKLGDFATTPAGKAILEGALRAFVSTYVPLVNTWNTVSGFVEKVRDEVMGDGKDAARAPAPVEQAPRTGISELLGRRMAEGAEETHPGAEGR